MNKQELVLAITTELQRELEQHVQAARASLAEATHEQSRAEHQYDTRGLEAAYLARGQSRQVAELEQTIEQLQSLDPKSFAPGEPVGLAAVVELEGKGEQLTYFVAPRGGGTEVQVQQREVLVITPQSPLGQQLMGKRAGEKLCLEIGSDRHEYRILQVY